MTDVTANNAKLLGYTRARGDRRFRRARRKKLYVPKSSTCHRNDLQWRQQVPKLFLLEFYKVSGAAQ